MKIRVKIGLITSKGGHLFQLMKLKSYWQRHNRFWVVDRGMDTDYFLKNEKKYFGYFPDSRNAFNALFNVILALKILKRERPDILLSDGAGIAVPFLIMGKLFGLKTVFIEPYDFVCYPSLTGKIVYKFVDLFLVQHKFQIKWYPKAKYWGSLL